MSIQENFLTFKCATDLERGRFVTITPATDTVAYTSAAAAANAVTVGKGENGVVAVQMLGDKSKSFWFEAGATIAVGANVEVGTDGKGITRTSTNAIVAIAKQVGVANTLTTGYNT